MATGWVQRSANGAAWRGFVRLDNGQKRSRTFTKKVDANDWQRELVRSIRRSEFIDPHSGKMIYGRWHEVFLTNEVALRGSTLARDESVFNTHILPAFKDMPLEQITHSVVQAWIASVSRKKVKPSTVEKVYHIFTKTMSAAVLAGLIPRSPCHDMNLPEVVHQEMRFLTPKQLAALANAITSWYSTLVMTAGYSGLRFGELAALRRDRIDFETGWIDVRATASEVKGELVFGPPKTKAGARRVPIPGELAGLLAQHCTDRKIGPRDLVFQGRQGGALRLRAWRARQFVPAVVAAGLAPLRPHDLRHTAIAIWIAAGVDPKQIAKRAGHTSVAVVLDRYGHLMPDNEKQFSDAVGSLFVPTGPRASTDAT